MNTSQQRWESFICKWAAAIKIKPMFTTQLEIVYYKEEVWLWIKYIDYTNAVWSFSGDIEGGKATLSKRQKVPIDFFPHAKQLLSTLLLLGFTRPRNPMYCEDTIEGSPRHGLMHHVYNIGYGGRTAVRIALDQDQI